MPTNSCPPIPRSASPTRCCRSSGTAMSSETRDSWVPTGHKPSGRSRAIGSGSTRAYPPRSCPVALHRELQGLHDRIEGTFHEIQNIKYCRECLWRNAVLGVMTQVIAQMTCHIYKLLLCCCLGLDVQMYTAHPVQFHISRVIFSRILKTIHSVHSEVVRQLYRSCNSSASRQCDTINRRLSDAYLERGIYGDRSDLGHG